MIDRVKVKQVFADYVSKYNAEDPKIKLKIIHTMKVAEIAEAIAKSIDLSDEDVDLAWLCGMLHDYGRFEQVTRYNTFSDADSVDHAKLGADLLFVQGDIENFNLPYEAGSRELEELEIAIRNHSAFRVQEGLSARETLFCNILRDADKVDIFRVNRETPLEDIFNVTTEELENSPVADAVKKSFDEGHAVLRALKEYPADHIVGHASLYFELVYDYSRELTKEQGYLADLLRVQSKNPDTQAFFDHMRQVIDL